VVEWLAELLARARAEVVVEEVGRIRVVGTPAEEPQAGERARRIRVEERTGLLEVQADVDAEVLLQLRLDRRRDLGRIRKVAADGGPERQLVGLAEVEVRGLQ